MRIEETKFWNLILHENQYYLGYSIIILKRKCGHLSDLTKEEFEDFFKIIVKFEKNVKKSFGAIMFNWSCLMNDSYKSRKSQAQVHWHVRPRYNNKFEFAGEIFNDEFFGHHYDKHKTKIVPEEVLKAIKEKIK